MGFNNPGLRKDGIDIAIPLRKTWEAESSTLDKFGQVKKSTALDQSHTDYATSFERLWEYGDVFIKHVSSPNTPTSEYKMTNLLQK